jgi:hypothetical protein
MYSLPAVVPEGEVPRSDVVAARLARRAAGLFGVSWPGNPFDRTWVCGFAGLTLAEVARGAPYPSRAETRGLDASVPATSADGTSASGTTWSWAGRGVWTPPGAPGPNTIATATLNRFGPDTKAAVVLTAANRLLRDATEAVAAVARHLADCDVDSQLRLAVWAGLVLEAYRAQPALVVAGVQARAAQRSLTSRWGAHLVVPEELGSAGGARSELPLATGADGLDACGLEAYGEALDDPLRPTRLDLGDATLPLLRLRGHRQKAGRSSGPLDLVGDRLEDVADAWCRRLLQLGRPGRGVMWLVEQDGHRQVHTYLRVGAVVAPFVAETLAGPVTARLAQPPPLPDRATLSAAPLFQRRGHLLAVHVAANVLRYRDEVLESFPTARERTADRVSEGAILAEAVLDPQDPVTYLLRGYRLYLDLWDRFRPALPRADHLEDLIENLTSFQSEIVQAGDRHDVDPATVSYLLELTNVALARALPAAADPARLGRALSRSWGACLAARGLAGSDVLADPAGVHPSQAFHLHHYAEHVAARGRPADLRRALALQERVCAVRDDVIRREPAGYPAKAAAARTSHELAASLATRLAEALPDRERTARAAARATAEGHASAVLENPSTAALLRSKDPGAAVVSTARSVLPPLAENLDRHAPEVRRHARALAGLASGLVTGAEAAWFRTFAEPAP